MQTQPLPFLRGYNRQVAKEPTITYKNRYLENNILLNDSQVSAISRPALKKWIEVGEGPIRSIFSAPGMFNDDVFVVSNLSLYRIDSAGTATNVGVISTDPLGSLSWAPVAQIGSVPGRLFFAEGGVLWVYTDNGQAVGHLQASGTISNTEQVVIDGVYYTWTNGSVDSGTPDGSSGNPWLVALGGTPAASISNLYDAINAEGTAGTTYSTDLTQHTTVRAVVLSATDLYIYAVEPGLVGNSITTTETGANLAWSAATLENGGDSQLRQVDTPNDVGAISIAHINSYVIVVPVQAEDLETLGRFYWIEPGETYVDALNFATAERSADKLHQVGVFANLFWLYGQVTTEAWLTTGDANNPMARYQSILFDRGSWEGTAIQIKDKLYAVDENGGVFRNQGGSQERITKDRPDIEERIRKAMQTQTSS